MNKQFIIYDLETGKIKRYGRCSESILRLQAQDGEGVLESTATDADHRVDPSTRKVIAAPEIRVAINAGRAAARDARAARRTATIARLNAIINNPTTDPAIKILAEIELART